MVWPATKIFSFCFDLISFGTIHYYWSRLCRFCWSMKNRCVCINNLWYRKVEWKQQQQQKMYRQFPWIIWSGVICICAMNLNYDTQKVNMTKQYLCVCVCEYNVYTEYLMPCQLCKNGFCFLFPYAIFGVFLVSFIVICLCDLFPLRHTHTPSIFFRWKIIGFDSFPSKTKSILDESVLFFPTYISLAHKNWFIHKT